MNGLKTISRIVVVSILAFLGLVVFLDQYGQKRPSSGNYDAIVVAGCRVKSNGEPSLALQARVRHAVQLYKEGYSSKLIFTGGTPDNRPTEAKAAQKYATEVLGVPSDAILLEENSTSTEENASLSKEKYDGIHRIIVVSDSYHIYRSERVFGRYFSEVIGSGRVPKWNVRWSGAVREVLAVGYYTLFGKI